MSTQPLLAERKLTKYFRAPNQQIQQPLNIATGVTIRSDANRIFQALTQPEYLETWIAVPGDEGDSYLLASHRSAGFRLDHYRSGTLDLMISGEYRVCRRRKLLFTWRTTRDNTSAESLVFIGLHGNFDDTLLELHHRGFSSPAECSWQHEMWTLSLDRLSRLFGC